MPLTAGWTEPDTTAFRYDSWPDDGGTEVQFRLVYRGRLPAASAQGGGTRIKDKHDIRRALHKQLQELWRTHPFIADYAKAARGVLSGKPKIVNHPRGPRTSYEPFFVRDQPLLDDLSSKYDRCGYQFLPLIGGAFGLGTETICALDILFLRRDMPGNIIVKGSGGGDIDNRLKILFDALRIPERCDEIKDLPPRSDEKPFFCLLEDDSLITEVRVTTDRLLEPLADGEHEHDVVLIIGVKALAVGANFADIGSRKLLDDAAKTYDDLKDWPREGEIE